MQRSNSRGFGGQRPGGYSLIELLVVIAIIAIVTAILLPVFASVREKGRQKTAMSNLHAISVGISQFQLDNHRAPEVLFAYAGAAGQSMTAATYDPQRPGLYPQFIKDPSVFFDPNNPETDDLTDHATGITVHTVTAAGALSTATRDFYKADAYDISPQIAVGGDTLNPTTYVPRYQQSWTSVTGKTPPGAMPKTDYDRQMRFPNAPGETYVTATTYHVPKGKVIVLWENGEAKAIDVSRFLQSGPDAASLSVSGNVSNANFWKVTP